MERSHGMGFACAAVSPLLHREGEIRKKSRGAECVVAPELTRRTR